MTERDKLKICIPGERLFSLGEEYASGAGTYATHGCVYASLAGRLHVGAAAAATGKRPVEVRPSGRPPTRLPRIGQIVTARVQNLGSRYAKCSIVCVEQSTLTHPFNAILRKEDTRTTEIDKVQLHNCFHPADTILARVINLGDAQSSYMLSTAEEELGVVAADCDDGHRLTPVDAVSMRCDACGSVETRKVAKVPSVDSLRTTLISHIDNSCRDE